MTERLNIIYSHILGGVLFSDVGCDHGLISQRVLKENKYNRVIISDISKKSLQKAEILLKEYGSRVTSVVSDGYKEYTEIPHESVIAGMGGLEISKILLGAKILPKRLILNPMKNVDTLRRTLINLGYSIERDYTIKDGKFYDIIVANIGKDSYTEKEYLFGRENLQKMYPAFTQKLKYYLNIYQNSLTDDITSESKKELLEKINQIQGVLNGY